MLIVSKDGRPTRRVASTTLSFEDELQSYIVDHPEALPLDDLREDLRLVVVAREFPAGRGAIDAVAIDDLGDVYILETKLSKNTDKRRVIAQVLDYGAALWAHHGDPATFLDQLREATWRCHGCDLDELLSDRLGIADEDVPSIVERAEEVVRDGAFRFIVLMDRLDDALKDLIAYLNANSTFDLYGVELEFFRFDDYTVTRPKLFGSEIRKEVSTSGRRRRWDRRSFFDKAAETLTPADVELLRRLHDLAARHADEIRWGTGRRRGSFNPTSLHLGSKSPFSVFTDGQLAINVGWHVDASGPSPPMARLLDDLRSIGSLEVPEEATVQSIAWPLTTWKPRATEIATALERLLRSPAADSLRP